jgi:hypothetical protein
MLFGRIESGPTKKPPLNQTEVQSPGGYQSFSIQPLRAFSRRSMPLVGHLPSGPFPAPPKVCCWVEYSCPEGLSALVVSWLTEGLRRAAQRKKIYHKISHDQAGVVNSYAPDFHCLLTNSKTRSRTALEINGGGGGIRTRGRGKPTHASTSTGTASTPRNAAA